MADYVHGSSAILGARSDLGKLADRYALEYGLGPKSTRVALKAAGTKIVAGSGDVMFLGKSFYQTDNMATFPGRRIPNANIPVSEPGVTTTIHATMAEFGKEASYDTISQDYASLMAQGGLAKVEATYTNKSVVHCLESLDYYLAAKLSHATNPWTATEVDASGTPWSGAVTNIVGQVNEALINLDGPADSVILSVKSANYMRAGSDVVAAYGGNQGAGAPLDKQRFLDFWASFGITNVFIGDTALFDDDITIFMRGGGDAEVDPCGLVLCKQSREGENENGMLVSVAGYPHERKFGIYASILGDIVVVPPLGVRIIAAW